MKSFYQIPFILVAWVGFALIGAGLFGPETGFGQTRKKPDPVFEGRKNPFALPPGIRPLSTVVPAQEEKKDLTTAVVPATETPPEPKPAVPPLKLKAILISDHVRLASIDRSIVSVGDMFNDEKVLEIRNDRVILEKEGKKRTLFLDQSPVKLTVE